LVGHSDGGLFVRLYASRYPDEVVGMVLVDAVSEELDAAGSVLLKELLTQDQWSRYQVALEQQARAPFVARVDDEEVDMAASSTEMRATLADSPLRPMPLFVLTHGVADPPSPGEPPAFAQAKERVWQELQQQLALTRPEREAPRREGQRAHHPGGAARRRDRCHRTGGSGSKRLKHLVRAATVARGSTSRR